MREFRSVTAVMSAACDIQDALGFIEETEAAAVLAAALHASWATSGQSLEDVARALGEVRATVRRTLDAGSLQLLDACVHGARALAAPDQRSIVQLFTSLFRKRA